MRRHWFVLAGPALLFTFLFILPVASLTLLPRLLPQIMNVMTLPYLFFALSLYFMELLLYTLIVWMAYYLDSWIITDRRLIDIEQHGLFHREIAEIGLERVQNVSIEIPGFIPTVLRFGNIKIQTAGHGEFTISEVSEYHQAKDLILKYSRAQLGPPSLGDKLDNTANQ